jgi:hypothetical protein
MSILSFFQNNNGSLPKEWSWIFHDDRTMHEHLRSFCGLERGRHFRTIYQILRTETAEHGISSKFVEYLQSKGELKKMVFVKTISIQFSGKLNYFATSKHFPVLVEKMVTALADGHKFKGQTYFPIKNGEVTSVFHENELADDLTLQSFSNSDVVIFFPADTNLQGYLCSKKLRKGFGKPDLASLFALHGLTNSQPNSVREKFLFTERGYGGGINNNVSYVSKMCVECGVANCLTTKLLNVCNKCVSKLVLNKPLDYGSVHRDLCVSIVQASKTSDTPIRDFVMRMFETDYHKTALAFCCKARVAELVQAGENIADMCSYCGGSCGVYETYEIPPSTFRIGGGVFSVSGQAHPLPQVEEGEIKETECDAGHRYGSEPRFPAYVPRVLSNLANRMGAMFGGAAVERQFAHYGKKLEFAQQIENSLSQ